MMGQHLGPMRGVTCAALLVVIGCGSDDKPKPPPPPPAEGIELVSPGVEPRRPLRYALAVRREPLPIEVAMDVDAETVDSGAKMPTLAMSLDVAIAEVDQAGNAKVRMTVAAAGARVRDPSTTPDPDTLAIVRVMDRQSALLGGLVIAYTVSPAGKITDSKIDAVGRDLSGPMQQQVATLVQTAESLAMALPDQPVGVGAIWKDRRTIKQNQLTLKSITTIEITAIDGDRVTFKGTSELAAADQMITQGSDSAQVTKIAGHGTLAGSFDLGKAIMLGETRSTLTFEMVALGQHRPTKLDVVTRSAPRTPVSPTTPGEGSASATSEAVKPQAEPRAKSAYEHEPEHARSTQPGHGAHSAP